MNIIIPIGGIGKRFFDDGYILPKPLIKSLGKSILFWNIENLNIEKDDKVYIVYREEFKLFNFESIICNKFRNFNFNFISIKNDTRGAAETVLYALQEMNNSDLEKTTIVVDSDNFYDDDIISISKEINDNIIFFKKDYDSNPIYSYILIDDMGKISDIKEKEKISNNACVGAYCFKSGKLLKETIKSVIIDDLKEKNEFYISSIYKFLLKRNIDVYSSEIYGFNCLGTPNQLKSFSSNLNTNTDKYRFCFDLDNTLVSYPEIEGDYNSVKPIHRTINFLNFIHSLGHTIIIYTARRMRTHSGNIGKVQADIAKITFDTLDKFNINYDEVYFGKPYANFYIDDLAIKSYDDLEKETGFYNIHPETRTHNRIEILDKHIIKYSDSIEGESYYYQNIPEEIKYLFPNLIYFDNYSIKITKIEGIPLSFLNINNTLTESILFKLLNNVFNMHSIEIDDCDESKIYSNYYSKVLTRINSFDFSTYDNFDKTSNEILDFLKDYELNKKGKKGIIHGDPVFTNILIDTKDNIKMIDMRGKLDNELTIYGDIFYDYAKIYQSLIGYDHILMDREYDIKKYSNLKFFESFIIERFGVENLFNIKQLTKSLLLSLIPIHNNEKCIKYYNLISNV